MAAERSDLKEEEGEEEEVAGEGADEEEGEREVGKGVKGEKRARRSRRREVWNTNTILLCFAVPYFGIFGFFWYRITGINQI